MARLGKLTIDVKLGKAACLILKLLDVLPDNVVQEDKTWEYCWDALSAESQDRVKQIRKEATLFLVESEYLVTKDER